MNVIWKTRFSHCIDQVADVYVYQNIMYRWLTFDSPAIQTLIHRYQPERYSLQYLKAFTLGIHLQLGSCCLLGLGGGGVIHAIHHCLQHTMLTAIESNPHVIRMAYKHFMLAPIKNLEVIHQDANLFVQTSQSQYQHLLVDLYSAYHFPLSCKDADFFYFCKQRLHQDGILSINLASLQDAWTTLKFLRLLFGQHTLSIPIRKTANVVILAMQADMSKHYFERLLQSKALKRIVWDAKWGYLGI